MRDKLKNMKEKFCLWFWRKVPNSWKYWCVINVWAQATTSEYSAYSPNDVTWIMVMKFLDKK